MQFPEPSRETLRIYRLQRWIAGRLVRRYTPASIVLIVTNLAVHYAFLAGVVLLAGGFSAAFFDRVLALLPAGVSAWLTATFWRPYQIALALLLVHVGAGVLATWLTRRLVVRMERDIRMEILRNERLWIAPREDFAIGNALARRVSALMNKSRAVVRSARAMLEIVPAALYFVTAVIVLIGIAPWSVVWLASVTVALGVLQLWFGRRVIDLEDRHLSEAQRSKKEVLRLIEMEREPSTNDAEQRERSQIAERYFRISRLYFSRGLVSEIARFVSLGVVLVLTAAYVTAYVANADAANAVLVEQLLILLIAGRVAIMALTSIQASWTVITKYSYHAHSSQLYLQGVPSPGKGVPEPPRRIIGPIAPDRYGVSFYVDALNCLAGRDLRREGSLSFEPGSSALVYAGPTTPKTAIPLVCPPASSDRAIDLEPGDLVAAYDRLMPVRRARRVSRRSLNLIFRESLIRTKQGAKPPAEPDPAVLEDEEV